jgi:tryptophan-rich sensory protein
MAATQLALCTSLGAPLPNHCNFRVVGMARSGLCTDERTSTGNLSATIAALLWLSIIATIAVFYPIKTSAAFLLLPYLVWVSFAASLNFSIWRLNLEKIEG